MNASLDIPDHLRPLLDAAIQAEATSTQGEWIVRSLGEDCFVERPRTGREAYGIEVMGDGGYPTKRGDAEFIVAARKLVQALRAHAATRA